MRRRDRTFALGTAAGSVLVPGLLVGTTPLGEEREVLGYLAGWGLALLLMVPSYLLLARVMRTPDHTAFLRGLLGGTLGRMVVMVLAMVAFAVLVPGAPMKSFLLAFGLGYVLLTGLELGLTLGRRPGGGAA